MLGGNCGPTIGEGKPKEKRGGDREEGLGGTEKSCHQRAKGDGRGWRKKRNSLVAGAQRRGGESGGRGESQLNSKMRKLRGEKTYSRERVRVEQVR